jgi:hypothetical protein
MKTFSIWVDSEARLCDLGMILGCLLYRYCREITVRNLAQEALHPARRN